MIGVKFNTKDLVDKLLATTNYSNAFISQLKTSEPKIAQKIADTSISAFYDYLDGLARSHPGMLHHVYEWGQVGDPFGRLYELQRVLMRNSANIRVEFLESTSVPDNGTEAFYNKAAIMEEGISVVVNEKDASVLFFEIDGEEFFRHGPIFIANPGGSATRGSFLKAFNEFYTSYFTQVYLRAIRFYEHFDTPQEFMKNFNSAVRSKSGAARIGRMAALSWVQRAPGEML